MQINDLHKLTTWQPTMDGFKITTIDMHTGGEPVRFIIDGLPEIKGSTILEKRKYFKENFDHLRTGLMWEPRGHYNMYGAIITEPVNVGSDLGVIFMHNEGYSTMCGHATLALIKLALDTGLIEKRGDSPEIFIDVPAGTLKGTGFRDKSVVTKSSFINVPSFVLYSDKTADVPGIGSVRFDVAYGGAFYAIVNAADFEFSLIPDESSAIIRAGMKIKNSIIQNFEIIHPFEPDLSFLYGTIFTGPAHEKGNHSRNACVFADGELDRSATGSGVSANAALHHHNNELEPGKLITIESIIGTTMDVVIKDVNDFGTYPAVIPEVSGTSYFTGKNEFYFSSSDQLAKGFIIY
jgi:proline racemase